MKTHNAMHRYYGGYDENNRLCSRDDMADYLTAMRYTEKTFLLIGI